MQTPAVAVAGDKIEHELVPGFTMTVEAAKPCETDGTRSEPHQQYQITDPDGNTDWLCAYEVVKVSAEGDEGYEMPGALTAGLDYEVTDHA